MYSYVYIYSRYNENRDSTLSPVTPLEGDDAGLSQSLSLYIYIYIYTDIKYVYKIYICIHMYICIHVTMRTVTRLCCP